MQDHRIGRRQLLRAAAFAWALPVLGACSQTDLDTTEGDDSSTAGASPTTQAGTNEAANGGPVSLTIFAFLGNRLADMPKAFAEDYMERHPNVDIEIYEDSNAVGYPRMLAAREAQPDQPLVNMGFFNSQISAQGDLDDMWNRLDYDALPNAADISDTFRRANQNGIGIGADQIGIVYNVDEIESPPQQWSALWDDAYVGRLTLFDYWWYVVYMAARENGGSLEDMDPGWELWRENADHIRTLVTANPEWQQVLSNGTAAITSCWHGTGLQFRDDGAPVAYVPPEEGAIAVPVYLQTVQGNSDAQQEVCVDIVNEMLSPQWCGMWAETAVQAPANQEVELPEEMADLPGFLPETVENLISIDWEVVAANNEEWRSRWDSDIKANI